MVNAIELKTASSDSYINEYGDVLKILPNVKHINLFIGENNSGKSRLMRSLVNSNDATILTDEISSSATIELNNIRKKLKRIVERARTECPGIELSEQHDEMSAADLYAYYKTHFRGKKLFETTFKYPDNNIPSEAETALSSLYRILMQNSNRQRDKLILKSLPIAYIPVLRGVESFNLYFDITKDRELDSVCMNKSQRDALEEYKANAGSIYKNKVASAYNMDSRKVFTGENLYEVIRDKLLGREADRELIHDFELFISKHFYDGEDFSIIPIIEQGYLNVKIGDTEERALHNLGDGIKQLICILYKAFEMKDNEAFIFIEEPEINLHPGYQRKLLDVLQQEEFSNLYFFITTHSNHFVDRYFDYNNISLFKFINVNKNNNKFQVISTSPYDISLLNCLGVNNSSVFMANATIWVEGLSDKIYIKKYLDVYSKEEGRRQYKEGVDYSFVEYGGNNITHWDFGDGTEDDRLKSSAITNRAMIILDNDEDKKKKRKERLKSVFGNRYCELTVREIENTISIPVLEKTLFPEGEVKRKKGKERSRKRLNTKSAHLWEYIDSQYYLEKKYWDSRNNKAKINKIDFAKLICKKIAGVDDLSAEAKGLCENIYQFLGKTYKDINK